MKKKIIALVLAVVLMLSFTFVLSGCEKNLKEHLF